MSRHTTFRGVTIDMDAMRRENEKTTAVGNMKVNARGDLIKGGVVTKTAEQIARENHRVKSAVIKASIKGDMPKIDTPIETTATVVTPKVNRTSQKAIGVKTKEVEMPNGDIVIQDDNESK